MPSTEKLMTILDEYISKHKDVDRYRGDLQITYAQEAEQTELRTLYVRATDVLGGGNWEIIGAWEHGEGTADPLYVLATYEEAVWTPIYHKGYIL